MSLLMKVPETSRSVVVGDRALSLESRSQIIDEAGAFDDAAVLFGLIVSGHVAAAPVAERLAAGERVARVISEGLSSGAVPQDTWRLLQQLWYKQRIPFGVASLAWWQLTCLAFGQTQDLKAACDRAALWIEALDAVSPADKVRIYSELTGLSSKQGVVVIRNDLTSLSALALSALRGLPLIPVSSSEELATLKKSEAIVHADVDDGATLPVEIGRLPRSGRDVASLRALCLDRPLPVAGASDEMRRAWCDMPPEERTYILIHLEQNIAALEIVRFSYATEVFGNPQLAEGIAQCRSYHPREWSQWHLVLASILWAWNQAGFMLHELNQSEFSLHAFRVFLERKIGEYARITGTSVPTGLSLPDLIKALPALRRTLERTHQRCIFFDGGNFERREFLLKRTDIEWHYQIPASLREAMEARFGVAMPEAGPIESWKLLAGRILEKNFTHTDLLVALAEWAANAEDVPVDIAVFDVPQGVKLDKPWELEFEEVFCVTAFKKGWDPKTAGLPLNFVGVANAIGQRMRYNAVKKSQNYALVKKTTPQSFLLPDISVGEDSNHGGHNASGIRHAARVPMAVHYRGNEWRGIADVRLSRTDYSYANRFRDEELLIACRYGVWQKAIADDCYARDLLFDKRYCVNLDDGRNTQAKLGRAAKRGKV
jgi:hypothetical protein